MPDCKANALCAQRKYLEVNVDTKAWLAASPRSSWCLFVLGCDGRSPLKASCASPWGSARPHAEGSCVAHGRAKQDEKTKPALQTTPGKHQENTQRQAERMDAPLQSARVAQVPASLGDQPQGCRAPVGCLVPDGHPICPTLSPSCPSHPSQDLCSWG